MKNLGHQNRMRKTYKKIKLIENITTVMILTIVAILFYLLIK